jgi:hypothetical protein
LGNALKIRAKCACKISLSFARKVGIFACAKIGFFQSKLGSQFSFAFEKNPILLRRAFKNGVSIAPPKSREQKWSFFAGSNFLVAPQVRNRFENDVICFSGPPLAIFH